MNKSAIFAIFARADKILDIYIDLKKFVKFVKYEDILLSSMITSFVSTVIFFSLIYTFEMNTTWVVMDRRSYLISLLGGGC